MIKPEDKKVIFVLLNLVALAASIILWIRYLVFNPMDVSFPVIIYIALSLYGLVIALFGYTGLIVTYYFGLVSYICYFIFLWETIESDSGFGAFIMTLFLYPIILPPFPIIGSLICIVIDWIMNYLVKRRRNIV